MGGMTEKKNLSGSRWLFFEPSVCTFWRAELALAGKGLTDPLQFITSGAIDSDGLISKVTASFLASFHRVIIPRGGGKP